MLATLSLEFLFAIYVFFSSNERSPAVKIIIALLVCLGIFQLVEYQVCGGDRTVELMRLGYAAITLLPALGIHLVTLITKHNWARNLGYFFAIIIIGVFAFSTQSIHAATCGGNYILIKTSGVVAQMYFPIYYYVAIAITFIEMLWFFATRSRRTGKENEARTMLCWLLVGYAVFLIPTGAVYLLTSAARAGLPSIMCGFAVFFAFVLTFFVYPLAKKLKI
ncbi:MAG: hypothetical protein WCG48_03285 [Candidatus Berkelbacteria bacterium]